MEGFFVMCYECIFVRMNKTKLFSYSLRSALLLAAAWPTYGFMPFLFVGFVPLLLLEKEMFSNAGNYKVSQLFSYSFLCFVVWNLSVSWWVYFASGGGAAMAILANAFIMTMVFTTAHVVKKKLNQLFKTPFVQWLLNNNVVFLVCWLAFEYLHHDWDLTYPWLTLGNGLAANYKLIQWYEYTGMLGGSLWILLANIFITNMLSQADQQKWLSKKTVGLAALIIIPVAISLILYNMRTYDNNKKINVVAVQPNIDPYNEKFNGNYTEQLNKMLSLGQTRLDSTTDYLVFPETALTESIWENNLEYVNSIKELQKFLRQYPKLTIVIGASTARSYRPGETLSETAEKFKDGDAYYDNYNTAFQLDNTGKVQVYHKSKLVPGVERMPFPALFKPFEKLAIDLGGTTGSLGTQKERTVFVSAEKSVKIAPIICYESIYGEFVSDYVKNGAQALFIITNDGWWDDTPGYKQHLIYGRQRAIETRRSIARSANTGISCFINERGDIEQRTYWWLPAVIKSSITLNDELTFYTKHGDYIGRIALYISTLFIFSGLLSRFVIPKKS